jgi:hypothetical protein
VLPGPGLHSIAGRDIVATYNIKSSLDAKWLHHSDNWDHLKPSTIPKGGPLSQESQDFWCLAVSKPQVLFL